MKPLTAIAISGGIDSLMAGYLLKQKGYDVIGIHFRTGYNIIDPSAIAEQLDIPYKVLDMAAEFRDKVVSYFSRSYQAGRTPNPCLVCNPEIKFGIGFDFAKNLGVSKLATGHYARIVKDNRGKCRLHKGLDIEKDQSYFLARLKQEQLANTVFPLGNLTKKTVIKLAAKKGFAPVTKKESQDICFIRQGSYGAFLARECNFRPEPGLIEDLAGNIIGEHKGLHLFTIGQRRGINCPASEPFYVVCIDKKRNRLIVGFKKELLSSECKVININWIGPKPNSNMNIHTRVRYRHVAARSIVSPLNGNSAIVKFNKPQSAITPGQGAVFYHGDNVLGGGWIT